MPATMVRMSWMQQARASWRHHIPSWVAWLIAAALLTDLAHFSIHFSSMHIHGAAPETPYLPAVHPHQFKIDPRPIIGAHLFGVSAEDAPDTAEARVALALSGVIAMDDPADGYAILGEKGQMRVYRVGSALTGLVAGHLAQVLDDRVIVALDGKIETLRLPRELSSTHAPLVQFAMTDAGRPDDGARADDADAAAAAAAQAARLARMDSLPSDKQKWLAMVSADPDSVTSHGIAVHPNRHYERQYGLHDGDVVTAINGVSITDADALDNALRNSTGTMSLTLTHDGTPQTMSVPVGP